MQTTWFKQAVDRRLWVTCLSISSRPAFTPVGGSWSGSRPAGGSWTGSRPPCTPTWGTWTRSTCTHAGGSWIRPVGFDTGVKTYNSLTRRKEPLILTRDRVATWYSCGPTVYDHAHLGHACSYVRFDILQRILSRVFGVSVIHALVITDIDDKIIKRSQEENMSPTILARIYEEEFKKDMLSLKVLPPTVYLRVTENVPQIVAFIERIVANGHAYPTQKGDVYFDIRSIGQRYGKFSGSVSLPSESADSDKRDARDFALWKAAKPGEPSWDSPWGGGRPGWHIECSTIASSVFGSQLDIHSGGVDLAFPHHENEVAQSEAYHRCPQWGNYFLHSGHLHLKGSAEKMSKSLKNFITIKEFLRSYSAHEFRMFCLLTKYRSAIDFSEGSMLAARSQLGALVTFDQGAQAYLRGQLPCPPLDPDRLWDKLAEVKGQVLDALADDFDTPRAVHAVMDLVSHGNRQLQPVAEADGAARSPAVVGAVLAYVRELFGLLGVDLLDRQEEGLSGSSPVVVATVVEQLCQFRSRVRSFALAPWEAPPPQGPGSASARPRTRPDRLPLLEACDALRKDLAPAGVLIKDRGATSTWELTRRAAPEKDQDQD
ncbi:cysteine--tRNA ligase, mitochondrial [Gadus chalcogrammus]|uniref:cysteine--tRNA ligase, mitochondrial n=1 Tax=Gadus chalcogrammus TaxID=1042646 RepID=UPI0024C23743|nr:cysteine--tRNA ligase, mitochondrial [Gadus chalcogrammus]